MGWIDAFDKKTIFEIILAANYMDIKCLVHLGSAKIATLIKQLDQEEINRIIEEEERYRREQQLEQDENKDDDNGDDIVLDDGFNGTEEEEDELILGLDEEEPEQESEQKQEQCEILTVMERQDKEFVFWKK